MTHLVTKNEQQHEAGSRESMSHEPRLWSQYGTSLVQDLNDTVDTLWSQIIRPAFRAIRSTIAVYWPVSYSTPFSHLFSGAGQPQRIKFAAPSRGKVAHTSEAFRKTYGLSLESAIAMRRIQGTLGDDWASAIQAQTRVHQGKANRWADARPSTSSTVKIMAKPAELPQIPSIPALPAIRLSGTNAPGEHEEILGLDDIFTGPVKGLFLEETKRPKAQPMAAQNNVVKTQPNVSYAVEVSEHLSTESSQKEEEPIRFNENVLRKVRWPISDAADASGKAGATQPEFSLVPPAREIPEVSLPPALPEVLEDEGSTDWFSMIEPSPEVVEQPNPEPSGMPLVQPVPSICDADVPLIMAETQEQPSPEDNESGSDAQPTTQAPEDAENTEQSAEVEGKENTAPAKAPEKKPIFLEPVAQTTPKKPETPRLFPDYRPLEEEESGFDHMARNNRILSRSITNLVDSYFQRAAQEEEPNFY